MKASIAMATYNGERYISAQLDSILCQLNLGDEIVISDDGSTDGTIEIIKDYMVSDERIKLFHNERHGVVNNFENAISKTQNDIIFIADQDDIWMQNKIQYVRKIMQDEPNIMLTMHNFINVTNEEIEEKREGISSFEIRKRKHGIVNNLMRCGYYGCCMCFRAEVKDFVLPFPKQLSKYDKYDIYISLVCEYYGICKFIDEPLLYHRKHGENVTHTLNTKNRGLVRINLLFSLLETLIRNRKRDNVQV